MTATAMRGIGQLFDMQAAAARIMFRTQARAASAFGWPDYSNMFETMDERTQRAFSAGTENMLQTMEHLSGTFGEIQRQMNSLLESQTMNFGECWQYSIEELQAQAEESMSELKELTRQQVEEMARTTESLSDVTRETLREGGEQFRETLRQGRELAIRQTEAMRREGERAAGAAREAAGGLAEEARAQGEAATERTEKAARSSKAA